MKHRDGAKQWRQTETLEPIRKRKDKTAIAFSLVLSDVKAERKHSKAARFDLIRFDNGQ